MSLILFPIAEQRGQISSHADEAGLFHRGQDRGAASKVRRPQFTS
jgi:hypothetical protein